MSNNLIKHAEREIMAHLLAIRDIGRDYRILTNDIGISMHVDAGYVSAFSLDEHDEKIFDIHQFIASKEAK